MRLIRKQLDDAAKQQIISSEQADALFDFWPLQSSNTPRFTFTHVLYYMGGLLTAGLFLFA